MLSKLFVLCLTLSAALAQPTPACTTTEYLAADGSCQPQNVQFCRIFTAYTNNCIVCSPGYYATNGLCAAQNVPDCGTHQPNQNLCLVCDDGFYVNGLNVCVVQNAPNCATYVANRNRCASCVAPLALLNGVCSATQATSCATYATDGVSCLVCVAGYFVQNGACLQQNVVNCVTYQANQNVCTGCLAGYYLNRGLCDRAWVSKCISYAPNQNYCLYCLTGYYAEGGNCLTQSVPNCQAYVANTNNCSGCQEGYDFIEGGCFASNNNIPNCAVQEGSNCTACVAGYYLVRNACLAQSVPNCAVYEDNMNICAQCQPGFYLWEAGCDAQSLDNCQLYVPNVNLCATCAAGYENVAGLCVAIPANCNAWITIPGGLVCSVCNLGYYLNGSACSPQSIANCAQYVANQNQCAQCAAGFNLENNQCVAPNVIPNCANQEGSTCVTCVAGYYLSENACLVQSIPFCEVYVPSLNLCDRCDTTHANVAGLCVELPANCAITTTIPGGIICSVCSIGYYLDETNHCSFQNIANCAQYADNQNVCERCIAGFNLENNQCVSPALIPNCANQVGSNCTICVAGYYLVRNTCLPQSVPDCEVYEENLNICAQCRSGYYLWEAGCDAQNVENCWQYLPNVNLCAECNAEYELVNGGCVPISVECGPGFIRVGDMCVAIPANCDAWISIPGGVACSTCSFGYYLNGNECSPQSVANCANYTANTNTCVQCAAGFNLENNQCVAPAQIPNCANQEGSTCSSCVAGYYLSENACLAQSVPFCELYVPNLNLCDKCDTTHANVAGLCVELPAHCDVTTTIPGGVVCSVCSFGYYPDGAGVCQLQNINFCVDYVANENQCSECAPGFTLENNECHSIGVIPNCNNQDGSTCYSCIAGYYLTDNVCLPQNVDNCLIYLDNQNSCDVCNLGFFNSDGGCAIQLVAGCIDYVPNINLCARCDESHVNVAGLCDLIPAHCDSYVTIPGGVVCSVCSFGFYLDAANACLPTNVANCASYIANTNTCVQCAETYNLENNQCVAPVEIPNCESQDGNICSSCNAGSYLANNACFPQNIPNCEAYYTNQNACFYCSDGFYQWEDGCNAQNVENCLQYLRNVNQCAECNSEFELVDGGCVPISVECPPGYVLVGDMCVAIPANCDTWATSQDSVVCTICSFGFYPNGNECSPQSIANCARYVVNENQCSECVAGFNLEANQCVAPAQIPNCANQEGSTCSSCVAGYYLSENACLAQSVPFCELYVPNLNLCDKCDTTHANVAGLCVELPAHCDVTTTIPGGVVCSVCSFGYFLDGSACSPTNVANCASFIANTNTCVQCVEGFNLEANQCVAPAQIPNCANQVGSTCSSCVTGYYLSDNACLAQSVPNCQLYVANVNLCDTCQARFVNVAGLCVAIPANCDTWATIPGGLVCTVCSSGYYLNASNACALQDIANCLVFAPNQNVCSQCATNFNLQNNQCVAIAAIANCANQVGSTCLDCFQFFYLSNNACLPQTVDFCVQYAGASNTCTMCQFGFILNTDTNTCAADQNTNCLTAASPTFCSVCVFGFYSLNGVCVPQSQPGCLTYAENSNRCTLCNFSYFLQADGTCGAQNDPNCLIFVINSANCDTCYNGYYVDGGVCKPQSLPHCLFFNTNVNTCATCDYGYYPLAGVCTAQSLPNCMLYDSNQNTCAYCNDGFQVANGRCEAIDYTVPNCATYSNSNVCTACVAGYYVTNGQCFNQNLANCQTYADNQNVCTQCVSPFVLSNGLCFDQGSVITIANCLRQTGSTCSFCALGYFGANGDTQCVHTNEGGLSFSFQKNGVTNYISVRFNANFDLILFNSATRLSIFEQSVVYDPVPPTGATYSLSFYLAGTFVESPVGTVAVNFAVETITPSAEWVIAPGTAPYTYTIKNVASNRYLQDCCTTGNNPVVFTVLSVDSLPPFSS